MFPRVVISLILMFSFVSAQETSITISRVDTLIDGELPYNFPISFYFRVSNQSSHTMEGFANGFRIYSPDGATWKPLVSLDTLCGFAGCWEDTTWYGGEYFDNGLPTGLVWTAASPTPSVFDGGLFFNVFSFDGTGSDTVGFAGYTRDPNGQGFYPGFVADPAWVIRIDHIDSSSVGKNLCIDSSFFPVSGRWLWANDTLIYPDWGGPYCFVVGDCCYGMRGNIAGNEGSIDIADLTTLAQYMFGHDRARNLPCLLEANVNGDADESIDISDLTHLVGYMFRHGAAPAACP